jgi:hypothetical protein
MLDDRFEQERWRLRVSPSPDSKPGGLGTVQFTARCSGNAAQVLARAKEILTVISESCTVPWPSVAEWQKRLPRWFLDRCAPAMTEEQAEKWLAAWRKLPPAERDRAEKEKPWSLEGWLYWMEPGNRSWTWWDGCDQDTNALALAIEVVDWPFPWGSFRWLIIASGAESIESEE